MLSHFVPNSHWRSLHFVFDFLKLNFYQHFFSLTFPSVNLNTGLAQLIWNDLFARFSFELSGNSNWTMSCNSIFLINFELEITSVWNFELEFTLISFYHELHLEEFNQAHEQAAQQYTILGSTTQGNYSNSSFHSWWLFLANQKGVHTWYGMICVWTNRNPE